MKKYLKRVFTIMLVTVICTTFAPYSSAASVRGDVNLDGNANSSDALLILQHCVGREVDCFDEYLFDVNGDTTINSTDALRVLMLAVGSDDPLSYSKQELLKFYSDALYTSCLETTQLDYDMLFKGKFVNNDDLSDSMTFEEPYSGNAVFENGYDEYELTAFDYVPVGHWIDEEGVTDAVITKTETGYEVKITLIEEATTLDDPYPWYNGTYAGFYLDVFFTESDGIHAEKVDSSYPGSTIVANITEDGYVENVRFEVPFVADIVLAANETNEKLNVTQSGTYTYEVSFSF